MTFEQYRTLYEADAGCTSPGEAPSSAPTTRLHVAEQIVRDLSTYQGNIAVVGAHRCGKSTVLNLVHNRLMERLAEMTQRRGSVPLAIIPLRINAALTPIREFPLAIIQAIDQLEREAREARERERAAGAAAGADRIAKQRHEERGNAAEALESLFGKMSAWFAEVLQKDLDIEVDANLIRLRLSGKSRMGESEKVTLEQYRRLVAQESPAHELRRGLAFLHDALRQASAELESKLGARPRFLVIIDEVRDGLVWGEDQAATAAWRSIIEAPEFRSIRWLVASTRPIRQELLYSPVSNVFREKNLGGLSLDEAQRFLNAFGNAVPGKLAPVLTPLGRKALLAWTGRLPFLLQVACSYVFERATERHVPLITLDLWCPSGKGA